MHSVLNDNFWSWSLRTVSVSFRWRWYGILQCSLGWIAVVGVTHFLPHLLLFHEEGIAFLKREREDPLNNEKNFLHRNGFGHLSHDLSSNNGQIQRRWSSLSHSLLHASQFVELNHKRVLPGNWRSSHEINPLIQLRSEVYHRWWRCKWSINHAN